MIIANTLPKLLLNIKQNYHNKTALSYRMNDAWHSIPSEEFVRQVEHITFGLLSLGIKKNENLGIVSESSPFWLMADMGILSAGGVSTPIFKKISPENLAYEFKDASLKTVFIGHMEVYNELKDLKIKVKNIITMGFSVNDDPHTITLSRLQEMGKEYQTKSKKSWEMLIDKLNPDDLATIIYTSGSTGVPKGVLLSHKNILSQMAGAGARFPLDTTGVPVLSVLPLAHIFEKMVICYYLSINASIYFSDDIKKTGLYLKEIRPVCFSVVPRILEKVYAKIALAVEESRGVKGIIARKAFRRALTKDPDSSGSGFRDRLYNNMVYGKFQEAMGGQLKYLISGAAPMPVQVGRFLMNIGIPLYEGYGLTEASPVLASNFPGNSKLGTVGKVFPSVEIKFTKDGEILARGPGIMSGYHNQKKATEETIVDDWLHTGDLGSLDSMGFLTIQGRKKELFKKSTGEYVPPVPIEQALNMHPLVDASIVIAEGKDIVTALLFIDQEAIPAFREKMGASEMDNEIFLKSTQVMNNFKNHIEEMNKHLHHCEKVLDFRLVSTPLTIEGGELTPTMKIRRKMVEERYSSLIEDMYINHNIINMY